MSESRTKNSAKNIIVNNTYQFLNIIFNFILRTIFIKTLGENYLGINGLLTNILSVLSLAELGIGTAMVYSMYKPLADNNEEKLTQLISYYKVLYRRIAIIVFFLGIIIIPILPYIVNLDFNIRTIQIYYFLYLMNSVTSYLLLYKSSIIIASQKEYLIKKYEIIFFIVKIILQGFVLIVYKNYMLYLIIQIVTTVTTNILKSKKAEKIYSFIKNNKELPKEDKKIIWGNIKSLLYYQFGTVILNNTDNILISIILGTIYVGYYSNYSMIISALSSFTGLIFTSLQSSLGNFNVKSNGDEKYVLYKTLCFLSFAVYSFCSISLILLFQDFITAWIGEKYLLDNNVLIIIVLNYYITVILYPNWCFRYTTDLFSKAKYTICICSILNIVLSIVLGIKFGLFGIFIATSISRLTTTFWYEPYILYKNIFKKKLINYFLKQMSYFIVLVLLTCFIVFICNYIKLSNIILKIIVKEVICIVIYTVTILVLYRNKDEYKYIKQKILGLVKKN